MTRVVTLMPFETGRVFSVSESHDWEAVLTGNWELPDHPAHIRSPLGAAIQTPLELPESFGELNIAFLEEPRLRALFFPVGIGLLILDGKLAGAEVDRWPNFLAWEPEAYDAFRPAATQAADLFIDFCRTLELREITELRRFDATEFPWIYPIFLIPDPSDSEPPAAAGAAESGPLALDGAHIDVRWRGSDVVRHATYDVAEVEAIFVAASVAWQTLFVVDARLADAIQELEEREGLRALARGGDTKRDLLLFAKRATDASRALRWTISRQPLSLLEGIHVAWGTRQMWQSIEDKSGLVSLAVDQRDQAQKEQAAVVVGYLALALAILSSVSAAADLLALADPKATGVGTGWPRVLLALTFPCIVGMISLGLILRRGS